jgi:hypothetical protein
MRLSYPGAHPTFSQPFALWGGYRAATVAAVRDAALVARFTGVGAGAIMRMKQTRQKAKW